MAEKLYVAGVLDGCATITYVERTFGTFPLIHVSAKVPEVARGLQVYYQAGSVSGNAWTCTKQHSVLELLSGWQDKTQYRWDEVAAARNVALEYMATKKSARKTAPPRNPRPLKPFHETLTPREALAWQMIEQRPHQDRLRKIAKRVRAYVPYYSAWELSQRPARWDVMWADALKMNAAFDAENARDTTYDCQKCGRHFNQPGPVCAAADNCGRPS
jgi:hypothetical protein